MVLNALAVSGIVVMTKKVGVIVSRRTEVITMMGKFIIASAAALLFTISGCDAGPKSGKGFRLPDGNSEQGKIVFTEKGCPSCHIVEGMDSLREGVEPEMSITIGGKTSHIATYGELVTSVINPSHKLAKGYEKTLISEDGVSKMRNYNDVMTVSELIDLVAFLQNQYVLEVFPDY